MTDAINTTNQYPDKVVLHEDVLRINRVLGLQNYVKGACFGGAFMGALAFLANDIESFDLRCKKISQIFSHSTISTIGIYFDEVLRKAVEQDLDLLPFFQGIELCQGNPYPLFKRKIDAEKLLSYRKKTLFKGVEDNPLSPQRIKIALQLLLPKKLEDRKELAVEVERINGFYNEKQMIRYLTSLKGLCQDGRPIAFLLGNRGHGMSLTYDSKDKTWLFVDMNTISQRRFEEESDVVATIFQEFFKLFETTDVTELSTIILSTENHLKALKNDIQEWRSSQDFQDLHAISKDRMPLLKSKGPAMLSAAVQTYDTQTVKALLEAGFDPNLSGGVFNPLFYAIYSGNLEHVELLLQAGAEPNASEGILAQIPLFHAIFCGHVDIVESLLKAGANPHQNLEDEAFPDGMITPLQFASFMEHQDVVRVLTKYASKL